MQENKIYKLSEVEHVLKRPGQYIGSLNYCTKEMFLYKDNKFIFTNVSYIPGLDKCLNEILDNCIDEAIRTNFEFGNEIKININKTCAAFIDNGRGVPCTSTADGVSQLELAFNNARAGANFGDDSKRETVGMNGVGSFCVNCFSKLFSVKTNTETHSGTLTTKNNLSESHCDIKNKKNKKTGTEVYFEPDFEKFGIEGFDQVHIDLLYQRVLNLAICFPEITFWFNGNKVKINNKAFIKLFNENALVYDFDNVLIGVIPNEQDDFKFYSYVNGIKLINGGNHIDLITNNIVNGLREKLQRKCKGIMPGDIKHRLSLIVFFKHFKNLKFDSQTKENLTNSNAEINAFLNENGVDYDKIVKDVYKNEAIIAPVIDAFTIKEELKLKKEAKKTSVKKIKSDKFTPAIKNNEYLAIVEGDSAVAGISSALGRNNIGYFAMGGVPLNAYDSSLKEIIMSPKMKELNMVLGLDFNKNVCDDFKFRKLLITTDEDFDGTHISGLILGLIYRFAKNLIKEKRVMKLHTPIVAIINSKDNIEKYFMTLEEYKEYEKNNKISGVIRYFKGLGSWKAKWLRSIIDEKGLEYFIEPFSISDNCEQYLNWWLASGEDNINKRKEFIQNYSLDIDKV